MRFFHVTNLLGGACIGSGGVSMFTGLYPGADIVLAVGLTMGTLSVLALGALRDAAKVSRTEADT